MILTDPPINPADYAIGTVQPPPGEPVPMLDFPRFFMDDLAQDHGATVTATSSDVQHPVSLLTNGLSYDFWQAAGVVTATITFDAGVQTLADYALVVGHNTKSAEQTWCIESSPDGSAWAQRGPDVVGESLPDDGPVAVLFQVPEPSPKRFWRLRYKNAGTAPPRIAILQIGKSLVVPRKIYAGHSPMSLSRSTKLISNVSEGGQSLGKRIARSELRGSVQFNNLTDTFYRTEMDPFIRLARERYFGFAWRPGVAPDDIVWAEMTGDAAPEQSLAARRVSVGFDMRGLGV